MPRITYLLLFSLFLLPLATAHELKEVQLEITGDFPKGERIDPEVVSLNGKDVRDYEFPPGTYTLLVSQPGYKTVSQEFVITESSVPIISLELETVRREFASHIKHNVPSAPSSVAKVTVQHPGKEDKVAIEDGDFIKPGVYTFEATENGYETYVAKKYIWPDETKWVFYCDMIAKLRTMRVQVSAKEPLKQSEIQVTLTDSKTSISRIVTDGHKIKPGEYLLEIKAPGFHLGHKKKIFIEPSEKPYQIIEKLTPVAKPTNQANKNGRPLSFALMNQYKAMIPAYEILINGETTSFSDTFIPGFEGELEVKFREYETIRKKFKVTEGNGPFVIELLSSNKLASDELFANYDHVHLGSLEYSYEFFVNNQKVEDHHQQQENIGKRVKYTVRVPENTQQIRVYAGYLFGDCVDKVKLIEKSLTQIDVKRLLKHLQKLEKKDEDSLTSLSSILQMHRMKFSSEDVKTIQNYIQAQPSSKTQKELLQWLNR